MIRPVPELADGGYWYVVPVVPDPVEGGKTPGEIPGVGWCAWYGVVNGESVCAVRLPSRVDVPTAIDAHPSEVISGWQHKPYARVGGR